MLYSTAGLNLPTHKGEGGGNKRTFYALNHLLPVILGVMSAASYMDVAVRPVTLPHLLFGPELIKHLLDLHAPVVLHAVKGVLRHGGHHSLLDGRQLLQDAGEGGSYVGVLVPTLWTHPLQCID